MKITGKTLLLLDRLFWLPYLLLDSIPHFSRGQNENSGNPVLVIKFMGLGSIAKWIALCEAHGVDKNKVILLTLGKHRELCALFGLTGSLFIRTATPGVFFKDCRTVLRAVRTLKPSWIVDYERCSYSVSVFRRLLLGRGTSNSISFEFNRKKNTDRHVVYAAEELTLEDLFMKGIHVMPRRPALWSEATVPVQACKVLVNINASDYLLFRRYPMDSFAAIIRNLRERLPNLEFFFTGTASESAYVETLLQGLPGIPVHNLSGKWTIKEFMTSLASCALFITCDSGPLHLAAYMNVPTIVIWGPTQPVHFGYERHPYLHHVTLALPCSPCFRHPASRPAVACKGKISCMHDLGPHTIVDKALQLLYEIPADRRVHFPPGMNIVTPGKVGSPLSSTR